MLLVNKHSWSQWKIKVTDRVGGVRNNYFYLGLLLMVAFILQESFAWRWPWLASLQGDDFYKQLSGFALIAYLAHQWHCSVLRNEGLMHKACKIISRHKWIGSLAPLFFYAHSQQLGFAYIQGLSLVFFAVFLTGLLNSEIVQIHKPWFRPVWITLHVGLSTALLLLLSYHVYMSYAYQ